MKVIMVEPNKPAYVTEIGDKLHDMQAVVGGYIECVYPYPEEVGLVCCETAKLDGMPLNRALRTETGEVYDVISGVFFICGLSYDNFTSIADDLVDKFLDMFREPETFLMMNGKIIALKVREG